MGGCEPPVDVVVAEVVAEVTADASVDAGVAVGGAVNGVVCGNDNSCAIAMGVDVFGGMKVDCSNRISHRFIKNP